MFRELEEIERRLAAVAGGFDPTALPASESAAVVERLTRINNLAEGMVLRASQRAVRSGQWREAGARSGVEWLAQQTGMSTRDAADAVRTAVRMEALPELDNAVRQGELSPSQASAVAAGASADPQAEGSLIEAARREGVEGLRDDSRRVRAAARPDERARHESIRRRRYVRRFTDDDGAYRLDARLTPEAGARLDARLDPLIDDLVREARRAGCGDPDHAIAADALVALADGPDEVPRRTVHVVVDHAAFERGHTEAGETCEIRGAGPVPVAVARDLAQDAFLTAVIRDGTDITAVSHLGRTIPERLRTAVIVRDQACVVPGCTATHGLELDHVIPVEEQGPTSYSNLARLCRYHHRLKTHGGFRLTGTPGNWSWRPPNSANGPPTATGPPDAEGTDRLPCSQGALGLS